MTTELKKITKDGKADGSVKVSQSVFGIEPNVHVLHLALRRELANGRAGTANSKTRSDVRGGGRKPWKQKGTGRARVGSIRSPLWVGGGVIFGPHPRDFGFDLPKKVRRLAIRSALSNAAAKSSVVENFSFMAGPKTKEVAAFVKGLGLQNKDSKLLIIANYKADENKHIQLAARNMPNVKLSLPGNLSVKDLINAEAVIMTTQAVEEIDGRYENEKQSNG